MKRLRDFQLVRGSLWSRSSKYYRLTAGSVTPNGCWLVHPRMVEISDIDIATGSDVETGKVYHLENGTVPASCAYVH